MVLRSPTPQPCSLWFFFFFFPLPEDICSAVCSENILKRNCHYKNPDVEIALEERKITFLKQMFSLHPWHPLSSIFMETLICPLFFTLFLSLVFVFVMYTCVIIHMLLSLFLGEDNGIKRCPLKNDE